MNPHLGAGREGATSNMGVCARCDQPAVLMVTDAPGNGRCAVHAKAIFPDPTSADSRAEALAPLDIGKTLMEVFDVFPAGSTAPRTALTLAVSEIRGDIAEVANRVGYAKERVVLTRHGRGICALIPLDDLDRLEKLDEAQTPANGYADDCQPSHRLGVKTHA